MFTLPQEIEVWYIIPAIRREIAKALIKEHQITYEKTGNLLGITKSAASQYLKNKRAGKVKLHPKTQKEISKAVMRIVKKESNALVEIQRVLKLIRKKGFHCEVCGKIIGGKLHNCKQVVPNYIGYDEN